MGSVPNLRYADVGRAANNERLERGFLVSVVSMRLSVALMLATSLLALGACRSSNTSRSTDDGANGIAYGRTYDEQRFSPLHQINEQNVSKLGLVWSREFGTARGLEATPLVANGVLLPVYNNHRRGSQLHISCGRRGGYRNVGRFIKKENSY